MLKLFTVLPDETSVCYTQVLSKDGRQAVKVHFERPVEHDLLSARCELPSRRWLYNTGFHSDELLAFEKFLEDNEAQLWELARSIPP